MISGYNIIILDAATKVSILKDSETILNAILQVAPQTTIKNVACNASVENLFQAVLFDNRNIENIHTKINAILKSPGNVAKISQLS